MGDDDSYGEPPHDLSGASLNLAGGDYVICSVPAANDVILAELTSAEQSVARGIVEGLSDETIAARRGSSTNTVRNQIASIYEKLGQARHGIGRR